MWRKLDRTEILEFRQWAIESFDENPDIHINSTWHPVIKAVILKRQLLLALNQLKELGMINE